MRLLPKVACGLIACVVSAAPFASAKVEHLLPRPQSISTTSGSFDLSGPVTLTDPSGCQLLSEFFTSAGSSIVPGGKSVNVSLVDSIAGTYDYQLDGFPNEAYTLSITPEAISITAITPTGVIRAAQTLAQLAEGYDGSPQLECVDITDWPAFKLRGFMHDVGRSFIEPDELIHEIELLSRFKVNTFHWHMTENQAWRFEVLSHPELTSAESMTRFAGRYYSQDDCRRVAEAAAKHGIIIIPEIDMPGHSQAFTRATGLTMQTHRGKQILLDVLGEVAAVFPDAPYIHIGGDEVTITDPTFLDTMIDHLHTLGKKVVCWNRINGVDISAHNFDMTQMWATSGSKIPGIPNIDCRYNYTNHFDVFADLVGIYKSQIYYTDCGNPEVAGTISCPWNDRKMPDQSDIIRQNNIYANTLASAERAWIGGGRQYIESGGTTLPSSGDEYDEFADWERRFLFHKGHSLAGESIPYVKQTNVRWLITDPFPNGGDPSAIFPPETELADSYTYSGSTYSTAEATGAGIYLRHTWGPTIPGFFSSPTLNTTAYAYTYVYSPDACEAGALIEFQNYGRSEKDTAPEAGRWDRKGSRLWLNDIEILPPTWPNTGVTIDNEVNLLNENLTARPATPIALRQGWNKVLIKLPYVDAPGVRLNKWMFTFVITDTEGRNALPGLIYSPFKNF